jgi:predicted naringenin-chalcone synthase
MSKITAIGLGKPSGYYTQREIFDALGRREIHRGIFEGGGMKGRHLCLSPEKMLETSSQDVHRNYQKFALELSVASINDCLAKTGLIPSDIDLLVYVSSTGLTCPAMTHYIAKELGMREEMTHTAILGMGCGASVPGLRRADDYLQLNPEHRALVVATEVSNAGYHPKVDNLGVVTGNAIFADGSAALLVLGDALPGQGIELLDFVHLNDYQHIDAIVLEWEEARQRPALSTKISRITAPLINQVADKLLSRNNLSKEDINAWLVHSGGASILDEATKILGISPDKLRCSYLTWEEYGNMSASTILFGLHRLTNNNNLKPGDNIFFITVGSGIECDGILMRWSSKL